MSSQQTSPGVGRKEWAERWLARALAAGALMSGLNSLIHLSEMAIEACCRLL